MKMHKAFYHEGVLYSTSNKSDVHKVWYVSTKKGVLGSYDIIQNKFDQDGELLSAFGRNLISILKNHSVQDS